MELTEAKRIFLYLGFYKAVGNIVVPTTGTALLLVVAIQFFRSVEGIDRLGLAAIALGIAVIGFSFYQNRGVLNHVNGVVSNEALWRLYRTASSMAMFGYVICFAALTFVHHH
jgi:hypothetical protein